MRPGLLFGTRCLRARIRGLSTVGAALVLVAGLTVTAVSAAAASGSPPGPARSGHGVPGGHGVLRVTGNAALPGAPLGGGTPAARPQLPRDTTVMLPTGDRVRLDVAPDGVQQAMPVLATVPGRLRRPATFMRFAWGGDQYVVPDAAVPYLHSTLDPRLFDVSYLARAHLGTGSAGIPVHVTYTSPAAAASLPGVRVVHRSGVSATAAIGAVQAARLGQFLAAQWRAAYTGHSLVPVGRLPGIAKITLAPPRGAPPPPASPARAPARSGAAAKGLSFYTLTLKATDLNGKPGMFGGVVQNVDNASLLDQSSCVITLVCSVAAGTESLSVPRGTYSLAISVVTPDSSGGFTTALVVKPQVTVHSDTTVTLDARTAVPYSVHLHTVASATERVDTLSFWRTSASGGGDGSIGYPSGALFGLDTISPNPLPPLFADALRATPTAPVTEGSFLFDASTQFCGGFSLELFSCLTGPQYVLDFPDRGSIPSSLTYTVPRAALTTVHSQVYRSPVPDCVPPAGQIEAVATNIYFSVAPGAWASISSPILLAVAPGPRTDYWYSGNPRLDLWQSRLFASGTGCVGQYGQPRAIHPGQQLTEVWNKAPLVPGPNAAPYIFAATGNYFGDPRRTVCTACRQGDIGTVNILMGADSDAAHYNDGGCGIPPLKFYRNGILALDSATELLVARCPFGLELPLLHRAATYRLDASGNVSNVAGATTETGWTFRSSPADPAASLPTTETCAPDATRSCSFLPLLFLRYNLPLSYDGKATAGTPEPIRFTVTGQQDAPAPTGLAATVSASFDGGHTWTTPQAAASLGAGRFTATISQPALASTDGFVALRVTAHDSAGDSVTQTLTPAYGLTS